MKSALIDSLIAASFAIQKAHAAAVEAGRSDVVEALHRAGFQVVEALAGGEGGTNGEGVVTKKQRAEVVELLRCAADVAANRDREAALRTAAHHLDMIFIDGIGKDRHWSSLLPLVRGESGRAGGDGYEWRLLEAAARVEEGSWP